MKPLVLRDGTRHGTERAWDYFGCGCVRCNTARKAARGAPVKREVPVNFVADRTGPKLPTMPGHDWSHPAFSTCPSCRGGTA